MKTNFDVAIRMENKKLANGVSLFKPTNAISGEYDFSDSIFMSFDGESYYTQDAFINDFDTGEDYICSNVMTSEEFNKKYGYFKTFQEALRQYKEDCAKYRVVYFDDEKANFESFDFDLSDLLRVLSSGEFDKTLVSFSGRKEVYNIDNNDYEQLLSDGVLKVNSMYAEKKRDKEFCKKLFNVLDEISHDLVSTMYDITIDFPEEFEKSTSLSVPSSEEKKDKDSSLKYIPKTLNFEDRKKFYKERKRIIDNIKKVIVGHDKEVEKIVVEIFKLIRQYGTKNKGILLTGSTGCGKSKICELIAENLGRPCKIVDTTQLSAPGYKGRDIENYLEELYDSVGGNKEKAENSVIVFDEVDKLGQSQRKDDVSGIQVLNRLLMFLNGTTYNIKDRDKTSISTKNMIVIFCGSFSSVYKNQKFFKNELGFTSTRKSKVGKVDPTTEDFISLGGMPDEMMGRFPVVIHLDDLTKEDLKGILLKSSESPIKFAKVEFAGEAGVELEFTDEAIDAIVEESYNLKTFARGLNRIVTDAVSDAFVVVTDNIGLYDKVTITKDTIYDSSKFNLRMVQENDNDKVKIKR